MDNCTPTAPAGKRCARCGEIKPATPEYFDRSRKTKDGLYCYCKVCTKAKREPNKEKARQTSREWREANRERDRANAKRWAENNPERRKAYIQQWLKDNADSAREVRRRYAATHPEYNKRKLTKAMERRKQVPAKFYTRHWRFAVEYFGGCCAVCGRPPGLWHTLAADHWIPLNNPACPGSVPTNIVPLCHGVGGCNNSKADRDAEEWLIERFGKRKAKAILSKVLAYFALVADKN